jgi:hypothetical protein
MAEMTGPELADDFAAANAEVIAFARACSDGQWQTLVSGEEWAVGVVIHHIAEGYAQGLRWLSAMVRGEPVVDTTHDIDLRNVEHTDRQGDCTVPATVALLEANGAQTESALRHLSAENLAQTAPFGPAGGQELAAGAFAAVCAGHARGHLAHARAAAQGEG